MVEVSLKRSNLLLDNFSFGIDSSTANDCYKTEDVRGNALGNNPPSMPCQDIQFLTIDDVDGNSEINAIEVGLQDEEQRLFLEDGRRAP